MTDKEILETAVRAFGLMTHAEQEQTLERFALSIVKHGVEWRALEEFADAVADTCREVSRGGDQG